VFSAKGAGSCKPWGNAPGDGYVRSASAESAIHSGGYADTALTCTSNICGIGGERVR
jgi:hypothetical protein